MKAAAAVTWLGAVAGLPAPFVADHLLRERTLPIILGIRSYGGGFVEPLAPEVFAALLWFFAALSVPLIVSGWLLWHRSPIGAVIALGLLPIEAVFWIGFALPGPMVLGIARLALVVNAWFALRRN
jgi:hypothetical protein